MKKQTSLYIHIKMSITRTKPTQVKCFTVLSLKLGEQTYLCVVTLQGELVRCENESVFYVCAKKIFFNFFFFLVGRHIKIKHFFFFFV